MRLALLATALVACGGTTGSEVPTIDTITPAFGPLSGGTRVVITGTAFARDGATPNRVLFGTNESPQAGVVDDLTLEAIVPAATMAGDVPITVFNRNGNVMATGKFHYSPAPTITSVSPKNVLFSSTNTTVTITGTGFKDENAGLASVTLNGNPAIDVQVHSDTEIAFTAAPGTVLSRPDLVLSNKRGKATKDNAYRYVPFVNPGLILFTRFSTSTYAIFYDPATDTSVSLAKLDPNTQTIGFRASYVDAAGDIWVIGRDSRFGKLDLENQVVVNPVPAPGRITGLLRSGSTIYATDNSGLRFGTFDPTTQVFTQIVAGLPCTPPGGFGCGIGLTGDGTTMYVLASVAISTMTTAGVRGTIHPITPANEVGEARFVGTNLFATGGPNRGQNLVIKIDPTTGAATTVHTFASGTQFSSMEVFQP